MKESYKLVVSFVGDDNKKTSDQNQGWVDDFCKFLGIFVKRLSSFPVEVTTVSNVDIKKESDNNKLIFIPVLSEAYLQSSTAMKELEAGIASGSPLCRVQKTIVPSNKLPKEVQLELAYNFYERSPESEENYIYYDAGAVHKNYWLKLIDLAYDIVQAIAVYEHQKTQGAGQVVFLAETTFDQEQNRDTLKRELQRFGHTILPDHPLSPDAKTMEKEVQGYLDKSTVAIHMVGAHYGNTVEGTDVSLVEFQNRVASEYTDAKHKANQTVIKRYLWSPPYMKPADERQMLYLDKLKEEVDKSASAEIIQVPLEILKSIIEKRLEQRNGVVDKSAISHDEGTDKTPQVYLVYDKEDGNDISAVVDQLTNQKYKVVLPEFEGNQLNRLNTHRQQLVSSDAVFIFSNQSNQHWLRSKINDVIKAPGFGKTRPFKAKAIYAPNKSISSATSKGYGDLMILEDLKSGSMNTFLEKLK
jgi:hypothetical protein